MKLEVFGKKSNVIIKTYGFLPVAYRNDSLKQKLSIFYCQFSIDIVTKFNSSKEIPWIPRIVIPGR